MAKPSRSRSGRLASNGAPNGMAHIFRKVFHGLLCLAALVLGFRLSEEAVLFIGTSSRGALFLRRSSSSSGRIEGVDVALKFPYITEAWQGSKPTVTPQESKDHILQDHDTSPFADSQAKDQPPSTETKSNRVHVGRHEILIRPQPHPDPLQSIKAHNLLNLVQHEQMLLYEPDARKQLLVITPTFARTFQALHLTCLIHTLRIVPIPLIWIVIEAGGVSNETAALLSSSQLPFHHVGLPGAMPANWEGRFGMEARLRTKGLRFVRDRRLDGIVLFVDDSNTYSLDFFKEAQKTKWLGAFSIGLLSDSRLGEYTRQASEMTREDSSSSSLSSLPLQGPACDLNGHIVGWYASFEIAKGLGTQHQRALEWAGFSLNAKLLLDDYEKPPGFRSWNAVFHHNASSIRNPLDFVQNSTLVEPLGNCGRSVLLWWLRVEARIDSKFPSRWEINPGLEIVVPSKRTPWPDLPPMVPSPIFMSSGEKHRIKQDGKARRKKKTPV
eukprot:c17455_g1_i1 orf=231-1721(+)